MHTQHMGAAYASPGILFLTSYLQIVFGDILATPLNSKTDYGGVSIAIKGTETPKKSVCSMHNHR